MELSTFRKYNPERVTINNKADIASDTAQSKRQAVQKIIQIANTGQKYSAAEFEKTYQEVITLIVKPTYACNLQCPYCYERDIKGKTRMTLETVAQTAKVFSGVKNLSWCWFGGEPLMMGKDFFREANPLIKSILPNCDLSMQSNGTLIDEEWTKIFSETKQHFPGISFDGKCNQETRGTGTELPDKIRKLRGRPAGVLSVMTANNLADIIEEYEYAKKHKYTPTMNLIFNPGYETDLLVDSGEALGHLQRFFVHWAEDRCGLSNSTMERYVRMVLGMQYAVCTYGFCVGNIFGIEPNGDIYPCGRDWEFMQPYGNVRDFNSIEDIKQAESYKCWEGKCKNLTNSPKCANCKWNKVCNSGCFNVNYHSNPDMDSPDKTHCHITRGMLDFVYEYLQTVDPFSALIPYNQNFIRVLRQHKFLPPSLIEETAERYGITV